MTRSRCKMLNGRDVRILLKGDAKEAYLELKKHQTVELETILRSFERVKEILRDNPQFGQPIRKELTPAKFKKLGITNLYRVELSNYWRMLYTIEGDTISIYVFILTISDHKEYDKLFGYRKK